ncbi:MAG: HAMP domain-containing sensor histidine kinase [Cyanobacteria bacterium P01_F01_bin.86]
MADLTGSNSPQTSERMLQAAYYRALELAQFRGGFLARTAHELRSPINKVISLNQMILEGLCEDPEEERQFIMDAQAASMQLLEHLDLLIRVSKIEVGRIVPKMQAVAIAPIFDQVQAMTHLQAADRNLRLLIEPPDATVQVWTDPDWLQNVLVTLIDMAIDRSDRGTIRLTLAPESSPGHCCLWLEDDRPTRHWQESIPLADVSNFDIHEPLSSSLRLNMVEAMLKAVNGTLTLLSTSDSTEGGITRLQCALPQDCTVTE